jgi:hypothetical protein
VWSRGLVGEAVHSPDAIDGAGSLPGLNGKWGYAGNGLATTKSNGEFGFKSPQTRISVLIFKKPKSL